MSGLLCPVPRMTVLDADGDPASGALLYLYLAGTTTPSPGYADEDLTTPLTNPVVADSSGVLPAIYLSRALAYKLVCTESDGTAIWTQDDVTLPADTAPASADAIPTGAILPYGGATAPTGYLLCNGAAVSRTTYATLFAAIGTGFGVGNGMTTFNLPDLRGRAPIGAGTGTGLTARTLGVGVGAETVELAVADLPAHAHPGSTVAITDAGHKHLCYGSAGSNKAATGGDRDTVGTLSADTSTATTGITAAPTIASQGGGGAHANVQPSIGVNFIIKT